jgi:hypothetical protein
VERDGLARTAETQSARGAYGRTRFEGWEPGNALDEKPRERVRRESRTVRLLGDERAQKGPVARRCSNSACLGCHGVKVSRRATA